MNLALVKGLDRRVGGLACRLLAAWDGVRAWFAPEPSPLAGVRRIVVVKLWGIGNWALLRPVVRDLRDRWPGASVSVVTLAANAPLVRDLADRVHLLRADGLLRLTRDLVRCVVALRRERADLCVDFEQFSTAGVLLARCAGVVQRVGFESGARGRDACLSAVVPFRRDVHASRSFRDLVEAAGVPPAAYEAGGLEPSDAGRAEVRRLLGPASGAGASGATDDASASALVVLHPGSGDNFPGRRWSSSGFAAVARHATTRYGARVVVTGSASEAALCEEIARAGGATSLAGRLSLDGLVALLDEAAVLVANDTGPVHLASALHRPVLGLYGPNTPVVYGPLSPGSRVFFKDLPCSPCLTTDNYRSSRCRLPTCMWAISTGEVTTALGALLRAPAVVSRPPP